MKSFFARYNLEAKLVLHNLQYFHKNIQTLFQNFLCKYQHHLLNV